MKIVITVISMVLMVRGCYCAVVNTNDSTTNAVLVRASSSSTNSTSSSENENPLQNVVQCFKADSLLKCFNDRVGLLIRLWREALLNSVRRNRNDNLSWSQGLEYTLKDLGKAVYYGLSAFFSKDEDNEARSNNELDETNSLDTGLERGHHKKKKVHKEVKKLVIKVIVAIFLVMQKIKWALLMIQTILLNNFIVVATLFVLSKTYKIWHEIKHKSHVEKSVVVYDNMHHQHYDDEHSADEGHGHKSGWNWWGRSLQSSQPETTTSEIQYDNEYYSSRVARSAYDRARRRRDTS